MSSELHSHQQHFAFRWLLLQLGDAEQLQLLVAVWLQPLLPPVRQQRLLLLQRWLLPLPSGWPICWMVGQTSEKAFLWLSGSQAPLAADTMHGSAWGTLGQSQWEKSNHNFPLAMTFPSMSPLIAPGKAHPLQEVLWLFQLPYTQWPSGLNWLLFQLQFFQPFCLISSAACS